MTATISLEGLNAALRLLNNQAALQGKRHDQALVRIELPDDGQPVTMEIVPPAPVEIRTY